VLVAGTFGPEHAPRSELPTPHADASVQLPHTRFVVAVGAVSWNCVAVHTVTARHTVWPACAAVSKVGHGGTLAHTPSLTHENSTHAHMHAPGSGSP
jgi:hypothetical protein